MTGTQQPVTHPDAARAKLVTGLFEPIREIVMAADAADRAWKARDLERTDVALRKLRFRINEYLDGLGR